MNAQGRPSLGFVCVEPFMPLLFAEAAAPPDLWHSGALGYMIDGGIFMWPILAMAILGAGVVIERFRSLRLIATDGPALRERVLDLLLHDRIDEAQTLCANARGPVAAVLTVGLHRYEILRKLNYEPTKILEQVEKSMQDHGAHITAELEKHLPVLATIANVAPMVGSVGTVVGMVVLFQDIVSTYGTTNIILAAAAGIKLKLIVTVWGLVVGIPAYVFYNYFTSVVNRHILEAEETASKLTEALILKLGAPNSVSEPETQASGI